MTRSRDIGVALALGVLALVLRTVDLDLLEFKGDEAQAVHLALPMAEGRALPQIGLMSSVGLHNPPLFVWLSAAPVAISVDPRVVTGILIGGLNALAVALTYFLFAPRIGRPAALLAALIFATATWPVLYGRKLWAQCCLPPFSVLLVWALMRVYETPKARVVALIPVLLCVLWQLHFSGIPLALVVLLALLPRFRAVHWPAFAGGLLLAVVITIPYLQFQQKHDWPDGRGLLNMASGKRADGQPKEASTRTAGDAFYWTGYVSASANVAYALGPGSTPDYDVDFRTGTDRALAVAGTGLAAAALAGGLGLLGWVAFAAKRREDPRRTTARVLLAVGLGYLAVMSVLGIESIYPHYFIILFPIPFLAAGLGAGELWDRWPRARPAVAALVGLLVLGHVWTLARFRTYLHDRGGTTGDYGVLYEHKAALVDWAVAHGLTIDGAPGWEFGHMADVRRSYADMDALTASVTAPAPPESAHKVRIYDGLRQPAMRVATCRGRQLFGPLVACPK